MNPLGLRPSDAIALHDAAADHAISYRELNRSVEATLATLEGGRSLIFLASRNDAFTALTYAAALEGGHPIALLDASRPAEADVELIEHYRPAWVAGPHGRAEALAAAGVPVERTLGNEDGELARLGYPESVPLHPDLAVLLLTSGTTGSRRLVRLSAANIRTNADAIATVLQLDASERPITSLPLHYTFGLSVLNSHLRVGATVVLTSESVIQRPFWETVERLACTSLAGVPYTYLMLERVGFREMELPTIHALQQAGGALDERLTRLYAEHMAARGGRFHVMYGQTEATARMAHVPPEQLLERLGSAGLAIPGGRFRIDAAGSGMIDGRSTGEVIYAGPNVMMGYADGPDDLGTGDELGGELRTGDIGYLEDGYLYLVGRSKRIAKVYGVRVNLDEVERIMSEHGPVAVIGGEDSISAFCAFGSEESVTELGRQLAKRLRLNPRAIRMRRVSEIPMSGSGKIDYRAVERWTLT